MCTESTSNPQTKVQQCADCQFDLSGQESYLVEEYRLMAVRCPECGQQQPAGQLPRSRMIQFLSVTVLGSLWLVLLIACVLGLSTALIGMSQSTAFAAARPFASKMSQVFSESGQQYLVDQDQYGNEIEFWPREQISPIWWEDVGRNEMLDDRGMLDDINLIVLTDWFWFLLICPPLGVLFRVLLDRASIAVKIPLFTLIILVSGLLMWLSIVLPGGILYLGYYLQRDFLATRVAGMPFAWMTFCVCLVCFGLAYFQAPILLRLLGRLFPGMPSTLRNM